MFICLSVCRLLQCLGKHALTTLVIQQSLRHSFNALIPCFSTHSQLHTLDLRFPLDFLPSFCKAAPPKLQDLTLELSILLFSDLDEAVKRLQNLAVLTDLRVRCLLSLKEVIQSLHTSNAKGYSTLYMY